MTIRKYIAILTALLTVLSSLLCGCGYVPLDGSGYSDKYKDGETDYSEGFALLERIGAGWNFGNTLDAPHEGDWSPKATKQNVKSVKKMGFGAIRLPVTWTEHIGPAPEYKIDAEFMNRVEEVADWIISEKLYCILNLHHDETWIAKMSTEHDTVLEKFSKVWEQIADRFKNKSEYLIFESDNEQGFDGHDEPNDETFALMNELNLRFVDIVRKSGGNNADRFLALPSVWTSAEYVQKMELPDGDGRILIAFHYYSPWAFTVNAWGSAYWGSDEDKEALKNELLTAYNAFEGKVPMYIGEYGAWYSHLSYRTYYTEYLIKTARELDMTCFMWDTGEAMDRSTNQWNDQIVIKEAVSAGNGRPNSFVKPLELYIKKGEITDKNLEIEYNGNELLAIRNDGEALSSSDYTVNESGIILKKEYLNSIIGGDFGLKTILTFEFTDGTDYELRVIYYDAPTLTKSITRLSLVGNDGLLPIEWNGDKVATIYGVTASGRSANARDNWTKYFRASDDFVVTEEGVRMTDEFRSMITENITLTFELFSGDTFDVEITTD